MAFFIHDGTEEQNDFLLIAQKKNSKFSEEEQDELISLVEDITILGEEDVNSDMITFMFEDGFWNQPERGKDMQLISEQFPDVFFTLEGAQSYERSPLCEDKVVFKEYYQNGRTEHIDGKIVYEFEEFDRDKMKPIDIAIQEATEKEKHSSKNEVDL